MCIACEIGFWSMMDALPPDVRERILREQEAAAQFACDTPAQASQIDEQTPEQSGADERKP
jgi:hypothetical protein